MTTRTRTRTPRDHDAAIAALRRRALQIVKDVADAAPKDKAVMMDAAASLESAASYLASITGQIERTARKPGGRRAAGRVVD